MNKALAILHRFPGADPKEDFRVRDDGDGLMVIEKWEVKDETGQIVPEPTEADLETWWDAYITEQTNTEYRRLRAAEYPPIGDQLDAIWKAWTPPAGSEAEAVKAQIIDVKARYPKPAT